MMLINSLLSHASDARWAEFVAELERLNVRKAVIVSQLAFFFFGAYAQPCTLISQRLMSSHTIEDLTSCILDFQANMVRVAYRKKTTLVEPEQDPTHAAALQYIWENAKLDEDDDGQGGVLKWRKLGFESENLVQELADVGVLGLDCLVCEDQSLQFLVALMSIGNRRETSYRAIQIIFQRCITRSGLSQRGMD
jgi:engulfment/cell motility protein 1